MQGKGKLKSYLDACKVPTVQIGKVRVPKLILGIHPYDGMCYISKEKDEENFRRFSHTENIVEVLKVAVVEMGITAVQVDHMFPELNRVHLTALWECMQDTGIQIALIPFFDIPIKISGGKVSTERIYATYDSHDFAAAGDAYRKHMESDPIIDYVISFEGRQRITFDKVKPYSQEEFQKVDLDFSAIDRFIGFFEGLDLLMADLGSEIELLAVTGRFDLIRKYTNYLRERFDTVVVSCHHPGVSIPLLEKEGLDFDGYILPVNKLGYYMFPTQELVLRTIRECKKPIIAIKPQGGGRLLGKEAFDYVFNEVGVDACMAGLGTVEEASATLRAGCEALGV